MSRTERPFTSSKLRPFGNTIFAEMTALAVEKGAVNLGQGFPDFEGPPEIVDVAVDALKAGHNQYPRSRGVLPLVEAIARHRRCFYDLTFDPRTEVTVTCGATEGIAAAMHGLLEIGDEVILFEPFYDSYPATAAMAGAVPRYCTLRFPEEEGGTFTFDEAELESLFTDKTRLLILNSPHNPTGKVFTRAELETIARLCRERDVWVLADEVYEHLTYDGTEHVPIATLPGMRERTITVSSAGKSFSFTGWKVGWVTGPAGMVQAAQSAHQYTSYATPAPLQLAVARALTLAVEGDYVARFVADYTERRDYLQKVLREAGFKVSRTDGTYFALADFSALSDKDDRSFAFELIERVGLCAIPPSVFYAKDPAAGQKLIRFAFCKELPTLEEAGRRLKALAG